MERWSAGVLEVLQKPLLDYSITPLLRGFVRALPGTFAECAAPEIEERKPRR